MPALRVVTAAVLLGLATSGPLREPTIGEKMVRFLQARNDTRVGGGECAHAVTEGLRQAGGEFVLTDIGADQPAAGDAVWGTLVKVVACERGKWSDSAPKAALQLGDVLQCRDAKYRSGPLTITAVQHTSVVAAVDAAGTLPTQVWEQNANGVRKVELDAMDLKTLSAGWVRVYRPVARKDSAGGCKFTLVNNTPRAQKVTVGSASAELSAADTAGSFSWRWVNGSSRARTIALPNGATAVVRNAAGYEIVAGKGGAATIRELTP